MNIVYQLNIYIYIYIYIYINYIKPGNAYSLSSQNTNLGRVGSAKTNSSIIPNIYIYIYNYIYIYKYIYFCYNGNKII